MGIRTALMRILDRPGFDHNKKVRWCTWSSALLALLRLTLGRCLEPRGRQLTG